MATELMIQAEGLTKRYGSTQALAGVDIAVPAGTILGLLGPNGAGKTTAVRVLTTLARPDSGSATVAGVDVLRNPAEVRRHIGVAAQDATLDPLLTGRQNLVLIGELSDLGRSPSKARAKELLAQFELTDAADRVVKGYSGGMRRRLDLAGLAHDAAARVVLGRADDGPRPHLTPARVGGHPRAARRGRHRPVDHAVPRGGRRAGPRHRGRRPRTGHRPGHAAAAEGGEPRRPPGGHAGRAARLRRRRHGAARGGVGRGERRRPAPQRRRGLVDRPGHARRAGAGRRGSAGGQHRGAPAVARRRVLLAHRWPHRRRRCRGRCRRRRRRLQAVPALAVRLAAADGGASGSSGPVGSGEGRHELEGVRA